jgi:hypothetical protein
VSPRVKVIYSTHQEATLAINFLYGSTQPQFGSNFYAYPPNFQSPQFTPYAPTQPAWQLGQLLQQLTQSLLQLQGFWSNLLGPTQPQPRSNAGGPPLPPYPGDLGDIGSYLQAQRLGGTLEGKTGIAQRDAVPGTRFAQVQNPEAWQASVARNYAYQFAAYAVGADALSAQGVDAGARALPGLAPQAQLFVQVASVFKGNLLGGPGFYNNPGLKQLLQQHGLNSLASGAGVGETDVQTIGAITKALNSGQLSLDEVINSGTIDNLQRYQQVINYVQGGGFNAALQRYDTTPL